MRDVRCLNEMLYHNCGFSVDSISWVTLLLYFGLESSIPSIVSQNFEVLVCYICRHDTVHNQLTKSMQFLLVGAKTVAEVLEPILHQ